MLDNNLDRVITEIVEENSNEFVRILYHNRTDIHHITPDNLETILIIISTVVELAVKVTPSGQLARQT